jgi:hypothetical protein
VSRSLSFAPVTTHCIPVAWQLQGVRFGTLEYVLRLESNKGNAARLRLARLVSAYTLTVTSVLILVALVKAIQNLYPQEVRWALLVEGVRWCGRGGVWCEAPM